MYPALYTIHTLAPATLTHHKHLQKNLRRLSTDISQAPDPENFTQAAKTPDIIGSTINEYTK